MDELKENYKRAAFADYSSTGQQEIRNALSTTTRLLAKQYFYNENNKTSDSMLSHSIKLLTASIGIETIFYLPNHFRQTVLVNSNNISFAKTDVALLDLMNYMFKLNDRSRPVSEFRISYFLSCYKHFWTTTLPYESISFCSRMLLFDYTKKELGILPAGILSGIFA